MTTQKTGGVAELQQILGGFQIKVNGVDVFRNGFCKRRLADLPRA